MKESYYFQHDYNARNDEKIIRLIHAKGHAGYGLYWMIVEMLYEAGGILQLECECIAFALHSHCDEIKSVIHDFGLFEINGNEFTSKRVQENLKNRLNKADKARKSAYKRWNDANALPTQCERNAIKDRIGKDKIRKDIKEKDNKILYADCVKLTSEEHQKLLKQFQELGTNERIQRLNDYIMSTGKRYKSHYHTILNWERRNGHKEKKIETTEERDRRMIEQYKHQLGEKFDENRNGNYPS